MDESDHLTLVNARDEEVVSQEEGERDSAGTLPIAQMIQEMIELRPHYGAHYPRRRLHLVSISAQSSLQAWSRWPGKAPREACNTEERRPEATKRLSATEERHL